MPSSRWCGFTGGIAGLLLLLLSRASHSWILLPGPKIPAATYGTCASLCDNHGNYREARVSVRRNRTSFGTQSSAAPPLLPAGHQGKALDEWLEAFVSSEEFHSLSSWQIANLIHELQSRSLLSYICKLTESLPSCHQHVDVYTAAIAALANPMPQKALDVFQEMETRKIEPSSLTIAAVMTALVDEASDLPLFLAWHQRLEKSYPNAWTANSRAWDALFLSLPHLNDPRICEACEQLWSRMTAMKVQPTAHTFHNVFLVHTACRNSTMTGELLSDLVSGMFPDVRLTSRLWSSALQSFASSRDYNSAGKALLQMTELGCNPNVRHYNSYLKALSPDTKRMLQVLCHMGGRPCDELVGLKNVPPTPPDLIAAKTVLHACSACGDNETARQLLNFVKSKEISGIQLDEGCYNLVLSTLHDPEVAKAIVKEMRLSRRHRIGAIPPSLVSYTQAVTVCRRASDLQAAFDFLTLAKVDGLKPDVVLYTATIWAAAAAADLSVAWRLIHEMRERGVTPNTISFNGLIATGVKSGSAKCAVESYIEMIRSQVNPDEHTYQLLARSIRNVRNETESIELLSFICSNMRPELKGMKTAGPMMEALISLYRRLGEFKSALAVPSDVSFVREMLRECIISVPPQWEAALTILHASEARGDPAPSGRVDALSLSYTMLACSKANQWAESLRLWRQYGSDDTSLIALSSLIGACGRCGRPDMAMTVLNEIEACGIQTDERCYRSAIVACNQAEHKAHLEQKRTPNGRSIGLKDDRGFEWWECAVSLIYRMKKRGLIPEGQSYTSAISACEVTGQWQEALKLLQTLLDDDETGQTNSLNLYCFSAAISACSKGGAWVEALEVYERMKAYGGDDLRPDAVTLGSLIEGLDRAGQKELAQDVYQDGLRSKSINPWRKTRSAKGETIWAMDLHSFSVAMAKAAVRSQINSWILHKGSARLTADRVVVVGKGLRSADEPVLLPAVVNLLLKEYCIKAVVDPDNCGRIIVPSGEFKAFLDKHR